MTIPDFIQAAFAGLRTSYAVVDLAGTIVEHDPIFPAWLAAMPASLRGHTLLEVLPELIGQEEELVKVAQGTRPYLQLERLNRPDLTYQMRYLNLLVLPGQPDNAKALIALVTDVTEQGRYVQELMQSRNELRLTQRKLATLNHQLDYLMQHYLPQEVVSALLQGQLRLEPGGELRQVSILFADVRDFTGLAERISPDCVVRLLNDYLNCLAGAIHELEGTICQFQGDNVLVMFNAPFDQVDHAWRAVQAGIALQQALRLYRAQRPREESRLHFGVGINTGVALIGNIGAQQRYAYTAIGDVVNLAARVTAATPPDEVWLSQATYGYIQDLIPVEAIPPLKFKGKSQPTHLYRVCL